MWENKKRGEGEGDGNFTVLGKDVTFKGIVHFHSTVQLDSSIEGEIHAKGMLVIGENATVRGTVIAETLVTRGKIHGNVTASGKVQLLKSAVLVGDVSAPSFSMEEGAFFKVDRHGLQSISPRTRTNPTGPARFQPASDDVQTCAH
jgi:cytoskeletal protein CcmA (bactofilin family)